jgi:hypothetical protein
MDELLQRLQATGLSPEKAQEVLATVRTFLEEKLPGPVAGRLDSFLSGAPETMTSFMGKLPTDALPGGLGERVKDLFAGGSPNA